MRFSLIGRELVHDVADVHLAANSVAGLVAVVACDKPPVGTVAAVLENNTPAVILSDGPIRPGIDPETGARIDLVSAFQAADQDDEVRARYALHACPGQGSCGGMFTYNTMQTFIALLGLEPLHMVSPASEDPRRLTEFPDQVVDCLLAMASRGIRPRDIVTPASLRNAMTVAIAMGGSTNVLLHSVEIARAAGIDFWRDVLSQEDFNQLSRRVPVLVNMRPFGEYSMVDVDDKGGLQVIVRELLEAGFLEGGAMTCTGETLAEQVARLAPPRPDNDVIYPVAKPFKDTGGLRLLRGNLAPEGGAILKIAGVEGGMKNGAFTGRARVFNGERSLDRGPRPAPRQLRGQRHGGHPLRGTPRRPGDARAPRPHVADHGAVPPTPHHHCADDGRPLLGGFGRPGHRPRRARGAPGWTDRAGRGRRHHCRRPEHGPPRLPRADRPRPLATPPGRLACGGGGERWRPSRTWRR